MSSPSCKATSPGQALDIASAGLLHRVGGDQIHDEPENLTLGTATRRLREKLVLAHPHHTVQEQLVAIASHLTHRQRKADTALDQFCGNLPPLSY